MSVWLTILFFLCLIVWFIFWPSSFKKLWLGGFTDFFGRHQRDTHVWGDDDDDDDDDDGGGDDGGGDD